MDETVREVVAQIDARGRAEKEPLDEVGPRLVQSALLKRFENRPQAGVLTRIARLLQAVNTLIQFSEK
jgi:hypothetical protein